MNTLQSFWNFFLNISLLDNTLDVTNEKKRVFFLLCVVDWGYCSCKRNFSCSCCSTYNCLYFLMLLTEAFLCEQNYTSRYGNYNISPWQERKALKSPHLFSSISPYQDSLFGLQITRSNFDTKRHTLKKKNDWHISKSTQAYCSSLD